MQVPGYTFNASALGAGGLIDRAGHRTVIPSLASVALAPTGGEGSAVVDNYDCDGLAFTRAESRVAGYRLGSSSSLFTTFCDIYITNLSVFDRFRVALLHGTVTSTRDVNDDESRFEIHAMFRGVEIDGQEVVPQLDLELCSRSSYGAITDRMLESASKGAESSGAARLRRGVERREPVQTSVVRELAGGPLSTKGNALPMPGLGVVHFGELLLKPGRRRLNLLRFEFGGAPQPAPPPQPAGEGKMMAMMALSSSSPLSGSLTVGSGDGNGAPVWPHG